jgi:hypothetical protein
MINGNKVICIVDGSEWSTEAILRDNADIPVKHGIYHVDAMIKCPDNDYVGLHLKELHNENRYGYDAIAFRVVDESYAENLLEEITEEINEEELVLID